ncbi:MAG: glycogen/starch/alpha-glucan phosphorylase [Proteobacteria bacterium]|nr:glycogen/starch/alpha-glucan phosphorylase [Pseudomonadota bacterium]
MEPENQNIHRDEKNGIESFKQAFKRHMQQTIAHDLENSTSLDKYQSLAYAVRDRVISKWIATQDTYYQKNPKRIYYFSLEFLMGRTLGNAILSMDLDDIVREALDDLGYSQEDLEEIEWDAGLGNGGLGRLAACFLDSMATLELPAYGFGIRYEYGMFKQTLVDNQQKENPDNWLRYGNPWEFIRAEDIEIVQFYGRVHSYVDGNGILKNRWLDTENVVALAYDVPIPGFQTDTVNSLKLWAAASSREFDLESFNVGDYIGAIVDKHQSEILSKVLYPNDTSYQGKELRLKQQYFMVSASLRNVLMRLERCGDSLDRLPDKVVIQLNDTHPSIAIPELMRILVDLNNYSWEDAWNLTIRTFAYTNHTVLPEALEKWPVPLMEKVLPRHMQIIFEINQRFLDEVNVAFPGDLNRRQRMSIIEEGETQHVRMSFLAIVGSFSVNGVAELHSQLLKKGIFKDFYDLEPGKFNNKTNGITPRRWLKKANPDLSSLITETIGSNWIKDLSELKNLESFANDSAFVDSWKQVKINNKRRLCRIIKQLCGIETDPNSLFDVQVKRIHEYKRQLLNLLHVITLYNRIRDGQADSDVPRTVVFGGKAAPGYDRAKEIIHLVNLVASHVNRDPTIQGRLKVVFLPNYGVSQAEKIFPGSDLSEQISTAGMEASGTGNMKFSLNGALTIGTLDGANIEIMEEVGKDNIFIFGKTEEELSRMRQEGYDPKSFYNGDQELQRVLNQIRDGVFSSSDPDLFCGLFDSLVYEGDHYFNLADYRSYVDCQKAVSDLYRDQEKWHKKAVLNVARMGKFSSDRVIRQYANEIWNVEPCPVLNSLQHK